MVEFKMHTIYEGSIRVSDDWRKCSAYMMTNKQFRRGGGI